MADCLAGFGRAAAAVMVVGLVFTAPLACSSGGGSAESPSTLPAEVQAMWATTGPWVAVARPDSTYVPGPDTPASVKIEALVQHKNSGADASVKAVPRPEDAAETLYADPTSAKPWAERAVMVGRVAGSDTDGRFAPRNGTMPATIQGTKGRVGHYGDVWFASWPIPTCDVCDQDAFVIGYGLTKARVLAIAETVRQTPTPRADVRTLPTGLKALGSAPGAQGSVSVVAWPQELAMRVGEVTATFDVWSSDPRLYAHLAFWSHDGKPIEKWRRYWMDAVRHGDITVTMTGTPGGPMPSSADAKALRDAAGALVPGDAAAVEAAIADAVANLRPLPASRNLCEGMGWNEGTWTTLSGVAGQLRWAVTLAASGGAVDSCEDLWYATEGGGPTGGGGGLLGPVPPGGVRLTNGGTTGSAGGHWALTIAGDVPEAAARVVVTVGGISADAELAKIGPEPGRRWFAAGFGSQKMDMLAKPEVSAYDQAGAQIATSVQG